MTAFVSGTWEGYYAYLLSLGRKGSMRIQIRFEDGAISGEGIDPVGPFSIAGTYDEKSYTARFVKTYPGCHDVRYEGALGADGLRGTWRINWFTRGRFQLWPSRAEERACTSCCLVNGAGAERCTACGTLLD